MKNYAPYSKSGKICISHVGATVHWTKLPVVLDLCILSLLLLSSLGFIRLEGPCLGFLARSVSSKSASLVNHPATHFFSQKQVAD